MFCAEMKLTLTRRMGFALLCLMLSLQGYAAMPDCGQHASASQTTQQHCAPESSHHHSCGNCCCAAAVAVMPVRWIAPLLSPAEFSDAPIWPAPEFALDRLDRPPRSSRR